MRAESGKSMDHIEAVKTLASERYLLGEMSAAERDAFEDHFFSCRECAHDVRTGALMRKGAQAGLLGASIAQPAAQSNVSVFHTRRPRRFTVAVPWAAAAALALVTAYQSLFVVPALRQQLGPQALEPVILRPETRGTETVIRPRAGHPITLVVEINAQTGSNELTYSFQRASGETVLTGRAAMPAPGTPLLLLVPGGIFVKPDHYILSVRGAGPQSDSLGEYHFVVQTP